MTKLLRQLLEPMNLAAYGAWGAIGVELWNSTPEGTGLVGDALLMPLLWSLHGAFLAVFVLRQFFARARAARCWRSPHSSRWRWSWRRCRARAPCRCCW
jgi:hypothetical protein